MKQYERSLIVQVCNRCPCHCPGCYNIPSKTEIRTSAILRFLEQYKTEFNANKITLSGGDPFLKDDLSFIIDELFTQGWNISLDGIGSTLLKRKGETKLLSSLKKIRFLGLPLDGVNDTTIQLFRNGVHFEECVESIRFASSVEIPICINTVVHAKNIYEIAGIFHVINQIECVKKWQLFQYMAIGPGGISNKKFFSVTEEQFLMIENYCNSIKESHIIIEPKSVTHRKNKYLLIGSDGVLWYPNQTLSSEWQTTEDENDQRVILGSIEDRYIIKKIKELNENKRI
ncbi:MAG: radical SAM protein [Ruminococcus sp.]|nr:radical SAM protein [Ruminococcus sp.]